jgi:hypothetical protein
MQQITLELDRDADDRPIPTLEPQREQQLITLMAQIIVAIIQHHGGEDHDAE